MPEPQLSSESSKRTPWCRFSLRQAIVAVTIFCVAMAIVSSSGLLGTIFLGAVFGLLLVVIGFYRHKTVYGAAGGVVWFFTALLLLSSNGAIGMGRRTLTCRVQLVDDRTGSPISGVNVRIRDVSNHGFPEGVPVHPIPVGEPGISQVTDAKGISALPFEFRMTWRSGLFVEWERVHVTPYLWIQVDAPGYERALVRLDSRAGSTGNWKHELPMIKIRLKPDGATTNVRE